MRASPTFTVTFDDLKLVSCVGGAAEWLLKTGLAGVLGQGGDPISKSSLCCIFAPFRDFGVSSPEAE
jgi:hypothetical protein